MPLRLCGFAWGYNGWVNIQTYGIEYASFLSEIFGCMLVLCYVVRVYSSLDFSSSFLVQNGDRFNYCRYTQRLMDTFCAVNTGTLASMHANTHTDAEYELSFHARIEYSLYTFLLKFYRSVFHP